MEPTTSTSIGCARLGSDDAGAGGYARAGRCGAGGQGPFYVGISDAPAWYIAQANTLAELKGWTSFVGLQTQYSLVERTCERELLPMAEALDIGVTAWESLGAGVLTGKYNPTAVQQASTGARLTRSEWGPQFLSERNLRIAEEVARIAKEIDRSPSQVAIAWVRQQRRVMIPILGATKVSQIQDNLGCLDFELSKNQLTRLDEMSRIELGFPHDFLEQGKQYIYGETFPLIDNHRRRSETRAFA